jgi:hypothetical protein
VEASDLARIGHRVLRRMLDQGGRAAGARHRAKLAEGNVAGSMQCCAAIRLTACTPDA